MRGLALAAACIFASHAAAAQDGALIANSQKAACSILLGTLAKIENVTRNKIAKLWYCQYSTKRN
jgi:hypothetical protein